MAIGLVKMEILFISILTRVPWKKLNPPPPSAILRYFQNQEYRFIIQKSRTRLAKNKTTKKNLGNCKKLYVSSKHNKSNTAHIGLNEFNSTTFTFFNNQRPAYTILNSSR